jgi:hypothetical protein
MDKYLPETWRNIQPGSTFILTDEQTVCDLLKSKTPSAAEGVTLKVTEIKKVREQNNLCSWTLFKTEAGQEVRYILIKSVDEALDIRLYFPVSWFQECSRKDLADAGSCFMFAPPANVNNFCPADLEMAAGFDLDFDGKPISFNRKNQTMFAESVDIPDQSGVGKTFTQVTEYLATTAHSTPELIFFEFGGLDQRGKRLPQGGWLLFLEGYSIKPSDVEILPV